MSKLTPQKKSGYWYLIRRVPMAYRHLDTRSLVKVSTGIKIVDDPRGIRAARVIEDLNEQLETEWSDLAAGRQPGQNRRYERARATAAAHRVAYAPALDLAAGPVAELLRRVALLERVQAGRHEGTIEAVLGGVEPPPLML